MTVKATITRHHRSGSVGAKKGKDVEEKTTFVPVCRKSKFRDGSPKELKCDSLDSVTPTGSSPSTSGSSGKEDKLDVQPSFGPQRS